jgi:hypothetical protein
MKKRGGMKGIKESGIESRPAEVEVSGEMDGKGKKKRTTGMLPCRPLSSI